MTEVLSDERFKMLLKHSVLTEADLIARRIDISRNPHLLHFPNEHGDKLFPEFQFNGNSGPIDVVIRVNEILRVNEEPVEVALWWITSNASIYPGHKSPLSLLLRWIEKPNEAITFAQDEVRRKHRG